MGGQGTLTPMQYDQMGKEMYRNVFCGQTRVVAIWLTHQLAPLLHLRIVEKGKSSTSLL